MNNRNTIIAIVIIILILVIGFFAFARNGAAPVDTQDNSMVTTPNQPATSTDSSDTDTGTSTAGTSYTMADVATHNNAQSCWVTINGGVYDLTTWISRHPGGQAAILSLCGKDGTEAFNKMHGGKERPEQQLASFKIGVLAR